MNKKNDIFYQAQDILSRRDHSEAEVRQKLSRKGFQRENIDTAIDWLFDKKLLNDFNYAKKYIESVLMSKPVGPKWFQAKLKQRGVAEPDIEEALAEAYEGEKEYILAGQAAESWRRVHKEKTGNQEKLSRFLLSRGFSYESVRELKK